jgi:hypothetical protein
VSADVRGMRRFPDFDECRAPVEVNTFNASLVRGLAKLAVRKLTNRAELEAWRAAA